MSRLTKTERAEHRAWLSKWHTPTETAAYVSDLNDAMGSSDFFNQAGVEFLRDAWLAAKFGQHRQSPFVRLIPDRENWPDFEAQNQNGEIERIECVEADVPGRRRGDDYREIERRAAEGDSTVEFDPIEDWITRSDQVPAALSAAISTKIGKCYAARISLLVLLNIQEFGIRQSEIEAAMQQAVIAALPAFQSVWVLWKERLYGPWNASDQANAVPEICIKKE